AFFFLTQEGIKEPRFTHVVAQFVMFEKDMHGFPKCVIEDFDGLLVDEGMVGCGIHGIRAFCARKRKSHSCARAGKVEGSADLRVSIGGTESHHDVFRTKDSTQPGKKKRREVESGKSALAYDDRVDKLHRDVLGISGIGPTSKCQQSAALA